MNWRGMLYRLSVFPFTFDDLVNLKVTLFTASPYNLSFY